MIYFSLIPVTVRSESKYSPQLQEKETLDVHNKLLTPTGNTLSLISKVLYIRHHISMRIQSSASCTKGLII